MGHGYDAIVVGARCAGAPTAMLLAREGFDVLLVDHATFPSDTVSTLLVHAPGVAALRRWGVLDDVVASGCPPIDTYTFDYGPVTIAGTPRPYEGHSTAYAPRRIALDHVLVEAAGRAGAEVRERFSVEGLVVEDGAVVGIRGHDAGGRSVVERATVVVGADGRNSRVARAVGAASYHAKPALETAYYTFWSGLPVDGMHTWVRPDRGIAAIPTGDGLTLLLAGWPQAEAAAYKADVEGNYLATLELVPELAERVRAATREERFVGGSVPNFLRTPYGPGWVLVGDAGYCKDPVTAQGISDAFHDAEQCAAALTATLRGERRHDEVMAEYHEARDRRVLPMYELTTQFATLEAPPPEVLALLAAIEGRQDDMDAFVSVVAGTLSPVEFFDAANVGRMLARGEPAGRVAS